jgi:translation initiation factor 4E transporter
MIIVDPKERLKEEKDGIVLSPQRRSFGTGCHVTTPIYIHL